MSHPWKVGLTGGIGCGKSMVAGMFARLGVPVIDADAISRDLTSGTGPVLQQLAGLFGRNILDQRGLLDRSALRNIIFSDNNARAELERILHPLVYEAMNHLYDQIDAAYCILSIPLLLETHASEKVDRILVIDCPVELQIERASNRDKVSRQVVENIIHSQVSRDMRLSAADDIIVNDGSIVSLEARVRDLHGVYLELSLNRP